MPVSKKRKKSSGSEAPQTGAAPKTAIHRSTFTTMAGIVIALGLVGWLIFGGGGGDSTIKVIVPTLSAKAQSGEQTFNRVCLKCHGEHAAGSKSGPPLVDPFYRPSHHADGSFVSAITRGVRQHHWKFGPMPPQPQVKAAEIPDLIAYIREIQQANGVF
ncbi:MAG: cytochrome c [Rhodospirillaceae bacterium]|jgi:mono/diheme cytochrome c family protein|nr:cytochrome c [Rhodospirillaceae bacterium]MBT5244913.1 cytochrome c [Rhodospirillaceae bacterium]MBT5562697.1 cytochrome c [Rhodospirillaceae bacterium]MBT6242994.1 cytochrome c [Rhodospirillaceae bacterium]MBT7136841.1 cytochrome c [Rhodospirillaceae bacterium]